MRNQQQPEWRTEPDRTPPVFSTQNGTTASRSNRKTTTVKNSHQKIKTKKNTTQGWNSLWNKMGRPSKKKEKQSTKYAPPSPKKRKPKQRPRLEEMGKVCRVVTLSDGMIPHSGLPERLYGEPHVLRKLDDIYHAMSHEETRRLRYMDRPDAEGIPFNDEREERKLVSVVRNSLEDAGFELLSQRDIDLCDSLNAGYLLRLSIVPDVKDLDPGIAKEFYPEWFINNETTKDLLFDGNVLVYWRGYDTEVTHGRLLLAKLDYLQTKLVQSAAVSIKTRLEATERLASRYTRRATRVTLAWTVARARAAVDAVPLLRVLGVRRQLRRWRPSAKQKQVRRRAKGDSSESFFQLTRYGGSRQRIMGNDPLEPFLIYETDAEEFCTLDFVKIESSAAVLNGAKYAGNNRVVNCTTIDTDKGLVRVNGELANSTGNAILDQMDEGFYECINNSELRCPYDQKVKNLPPMQLLRRVSMNNVVDLFSREGRRNLISSLFAKTELVEPTYKEVVRFDNAKLDFLAVASVIFWVVRLVIRYSNKLARYDLLVKNFLTSKISHRNGGALKYLAAEAGSQRAARAALVHDWLCQQMESGRDTLLYVDRILQDGPAEINDLVEDKQVDVAMQAALNDLEDLKLVQQETDKDGRRRVIVTCAPSSVEKRLRQAWNDIFRGGLSLNFLTGRR
eukprot:scaffold18346_cov145-Amphora_coffeaeformis.AAC.1